MRYIALIFLTIFVSSFSCSKKQYRAFSDEKVDWNHFLNGNIAVYVEAHNPDEAITEGSFGEIVLFNIDEKKKYYITNDSFIDEHPALSLDRSYVIFTGAKIGDPLTLKIQGLGGRRQLYRYDIQTGRLKRIVADLQEKYVRAMFDFDNILFSRLRKTILYSTDNTILELSVEKDSLWKFYQLPQGDLINKVIQSPDGNSLAIESHNFDNGNTVIMLLNLKNQSTTEMIKLNTGILLRDWSPDGERILYTLWRNRKYNWFEYHVVSQQTNIIDIPGVDSTIVVNGASYIDNDHILLLGGKALFPTDSTHFARAKNNELIRFDIKSKKFEWLTNDGYAKNEVRVYPFLKK